jgi:hypothetical protein
LLQLLVCDGFNGDKSIGDESTVEAAEPVVQARPAEREPAVDAEEPVPERPKSAQEKVAVGCYLIFYHFYRSFF